MYARLCLWNFLYIPFNPSNNPMGQAILLFSVNWWGNRAMFQVSWPVVRTDCGLPSEPEQSPGFSSKNLFQLQEFGSREMSIKDNVLSKSANSTLTKSEDPAAHPISRHPLWMLRELFVKRCHRQLRTSDWASAVTRGFSSSFPQEAGCPLLPFAGSQARHVLSFIPLADTDHHLYVLPEHWEVSS